jgi:hypothetical protein
MIPRLTGLLTLLFFLAGVGLVNVHAADEITLGRQAEQAGNLRQALTHYVEALRAKTTDSQLRERIVRLAQKIQPPPEVPEEARKYLIRGQEAFKEATSTAGYKEAAVEFGKALEFAPWWADAYFNQGVSLEKAGDSQQAITCLRLYLVAAPDAVDARKVRDRIYALEYQVERSQKQAQEEQRKRIQEQQGVNLNGIWTYTDKNGNRRYYDITVSGNSFLAECSGGYCCQCSNIPTPIRGTVRDRSIEGSWAWPGEAGGPGYCSFPARTFPVRGQVISQNKIEITYGFQGTRSIPGNCGWLSYREFTEVWTR